MVLHTVASGDTLNSIAATYDVAPGLIARVNGFSAPYPLAVGQCVLILFPQVLHTVLEGESLVSIAQRYGISKRELLRNNPNLAAQRILFPGQVLVVSWADVRTRAIDVNGYAYPYVKERVLRAILPYATYLTPFTYGISEEGGLVTLRDEHMLSLAKNNAVTPLMHISTLTEEGNFSSTRGALLLEDGTLADSLADAMLLRIKERGYGGLDVDFEFLDPRYATTYANFVGMLRARANALGMDLFTALAPKTSAAQRGIAYESHNYKLLGENSDALLVMAYEWGYTYGPPMAVSPLQAVRRVLDYAVTEIPPEKILMGFPNYGYNWTLPYVAGEGRAQSISCPEAVDTAIRYGAEIYFDEESQSPFFYYTDEEGHIHEVWFEDARSSLAKFKLVEEYGFRGLGYWNFMRPFPANFSLLNAIYHIRPN